MLEWSPPVQQDLTNRFWSLAKDHVAVALAGTAQAVEDGRIVSLNLPAFLSPSLARHAHARSSPARASAGRRFMRRRILAPTVAATLFGVVAAPALAQNSESAPAADAPMKPKPKPKTPAGGTVTVTVTNWREADLVEL